MAQLPIEKQKRIYRFVRDAAADKFLEAVRDNDLLAATRHAREGDLVYISEFAHAQPYLDGRLALA